MEESQEVAGDSSSSLDQESISAKKARLEEAKEDGGGIEEGNKPATRENDPSRPPRGHEYLDHTADVQLHAWGPDLSAAFEECAKAMFGYMTDLDTVSECKTESMCASGSDLESALFNFLDEWLFLFSAEPFFIPFKIDITKFTKSDSGADDAVKIEANGFGETFDLGKHPQGTEVKAITYSAMQIHEKDNFAEVFVIIDI